MILKPPQTLDWKGNAVFLAGSIDMGSAENWQNQLADLLDRANLTVLNPRRDDWDSTWEQSITNPKFREQVKWELAALSQADVIAMYFCPGTKSPITLLELGLYAGSRKLLVCCPEGFWRKGNVEIICDEYKIPFFGTLDGLTRGILGLHAHYASPQAR